MRVRESAPRVDVDIDGAIGSSALDDRATVEPAGSAPAAAAPGVRTVASARATPDVDLRVPTDACAPRDAPLRSSEGSLSDIEVLPVLLRRVLGAGVRACLAEAHARDPSIEGLLVLSFGMKPEGGIAGTSVGAGVGDAELHRCVERVFDTTPTPQIMSGRVSGLRLVLCADGRAQWREPSGGYR